jgi:molecular chaperone GrpE
LKYGNERLVVELLNVLDNFERALQEKVSPDQIENYVKGVEMTAKELRALLARFGVSEVPSENKPFDPAVHEAIGSEESDSIEPGYIARVLKKLYKLHDKVIRPAQVIVAKKPSE